MACRSITQIKPEHFPKDLPQKTKRLTFTPATGDFADAEAADHRRLSEHLGAEVPKSWPPKNVSPPGEEGDSGWLTIYLTHSPPDNRHVAVGFAGVKKWPAEHKTIQIGTALVPEFHGQHLGQEIVEALGKWGISQADVQRVICDVPSDHASSAKSLERAGFVKEAKEPHAGFVRFELKK